MRRLSFTKGHGTENDFVVLLDREDMLPLDAPLVRFLCDRRAGIGGDGVLRAVLAKHVEGWSNAGDLWFMDYRNADGSVAEVCGNGLRVFARYLLDNGLAPGPSIRIGTRAGEKEATVLLDGRIRVAMGPVSVGATDVAITVAGASYPASPVQVGNPHAVAFVTDLTELAFAPPPTWSPTQAFPEGANLEFVRRIGPGHLAMRVYERGVGETRSCGTGTVAAAAAAAASEGDGRVATYRVDVPGGSVEVELDGTGAYLTGPAVLVAHGEVSVPEALLTDRS